LQTLEGVRITGTDTTGYYVRFLGSLSTPTKIYTGGDPSKGIRIQGTASRFGSIRLSNNGSISLARLRPPRYPRAVAVNSSQILLSWEQGRGMDTQQFTIERKIGTNGVFSYLTTVGATLYGDVGLNPLTLYIYRVKTVEPTGGNSKYSMEFFATTL
ncbi:MAG: fibronectin type III domain-containing protein, partial [Methanosarcinaceae archaeon]|nr:fibronectin type III domain-containing protein [Methanosarcinaceae archaeon]